jgi:hypothetical protein
MGVIFHREGRMTKRGMRSYRLPRETRMQIEWLRGVLGVTATEVIVRAVQRLYEEKQREPLARLVPEEDPEGGPGFRIEVAGRPAGWASARILEGRDPKVVEQMKQGMPPGELFLRLLLWAAAGPGGPMRVDDMAAVGLVAAREEEAEAAAP